jgi:DNA-directed RNA polymerase specialized sigma24 family protein
MTADLLGRDGPYRAVYAYLVYCVGQGEQADELMAELAQRARQEGGAGARDPLLWLLEIARNCVYDALLQPREGRAEPAATTSALGEALTKLPEVDRDLLGLRYGAELSKGEIGRLLDWRSGAVDAALDGARARLSAELDGPDVETLLRTERPEPDEAQRAHLREVLAAQPGADPVRTTQRLRWLAAGLITVAALVAAVGNDATASAPHAIGSAVDAVTRSVPLFTSAANPGHAQALVTVCHFTGTAAQPYELVERTPQEAGALMTRRSRDLVPAPPGGCPTRLP